MRSSSFKKIKINPNKLKIKEKSEAEGRFGKVFKGAFVEEPNRKLAVKIMKNDSSDPNRSPKERLMFENEKYSNLEEEIYALKSLNHPSIIEFIGYCYLPDCRFNNNLLSVALIMPWCDNTLFELLHNTEEFRLDKVKIAKEIADGMNYLHQQKFIHNDLKSNNIFLLKEKVKIADFGVSKIVQKVNMKDIQVGTVRWMAPEVCRKEENCYSESSDVWSYVNRVVTVLTLFSFEKTKPDLI